MTVKRGKTNTDKITVYPYDYIFNDGSDIDEKVTVCLPLPFLRMLQSQSARYLWYSSYRLDFERHELTQPERKVLLAGVHSLLFEHMPGCLIDLPTIPDEEKECEVQQHFHSKGVCIMCMYCGTNCGCGDNSNCLPPEQTEPGQSPFPPPISTEPGENEQDSIWCRRFSWLVAAWIGTLAAVQGGAAAGIELTVNWLTALLGAKMGAMWLGLAGLLQTISSWLISSTTWQGMLDAVNRTDVITQLVCDIYTASSPAEAKENFKNTL